MTSMRAVAASALIGSGFLVGCFSDANNTAQGTEKSDIAQIEKRITRELERHNKYSGLYEPDEIDCIARHTASLEYKFLKNAKSLVAREGGFGLSAEGNRRLSDAQINEGIERIRGQIIGQGLVIMMSCQQDPRATPPAVASIK